MLPSFFVSMFHCADLPLVSSLPISPFVPVVLVFLSSPLLPVNTRNPRIHPRSQQRPDSIRQLVRPFKGPASLHFQLGEFHQQTKTGRKEDDVKDSYSSLLGMKGPAGQSGKSKIHTTVHHLVKTCKEFNLRDLIGRHQRKFRDDSQVEQAKQHPQPLGEGEKEFDHGGVKKDKG